MAERKAHVHTDITENMIAEAERIASKGAHLVQIADCLGISKSTLDRRRKEVDGFEAAIKRGRAKGVATFSEHLYQQSLNGKTAATIFALINMDPENWKQRHYDNQPDDTPPPESVTITRVDGRLPAANE